MKEKKVIRTKWIYISKLNEYGQVVRNKGILAYNG